MKLDNLGMGTCPDCTQPMRMLFKPFMARTWGRCIDCLGKDRGREVQTEEVLEANQPDSDK